MAALNSLRLPQGVDGHCTQGSHKEDGHQPTLYKAEHGQLKQEKADIPVENGIGHAKIEPVKVAQQALPLAAAGQSEDKGQEE